MTAVGGDEKPLEATALCSAYQQSASLQALHEVKTLLLLLLENMLGREQIYNTPQDGEYGACDFGARRYDHPA